MNELVKSEPKNEIVVYQPNETMRLEVRIENDTVWLNRQQMAKLFGRDVKTIGKHIANALNEELAPTVADNATVRVDGLGGTVAKFATSDVIQLNPVVAKFATTAADGKMYQVEYYGLEMITSVGYRVKSPEGVCFRMWANQVLRNYMLNGVSVNQRMIAMEDRIDRRLSKHDADIIELRKDVDFFISSSLPPKEKVFVEGKMLDAQAELTRIVKTAKRRIVLIDNYIDERTLMLLGNRRAKVSCTVYTLRPNSPKLVPALANYAKEYPALPITVKGYKKSHDRFLIVDNTVWHIGASLKDAGSALFAMMKMELDPAVILSLLP